MDTRRLILVMIFLFSSFMLWEKWQQYNAPKPAVEAAAPAASAAGSEAPKPSANLQGAPAATPTAPAGGQAQATAETFTVTTDLVKLWLDGKDNIWGE